MSTPERWLYLFSSDQSPLYAQDILNVLAVPDGQPYTFRYDAKYFSKDLHVDWLELQDARVVVVFALQQQARYHAPAFVPIRLGRVSATSREGPSCFVTFRVGAYVSLPPAPVVDGREHPGEAVEQFTGRLRELTETPYGVSASRGRPFPAEWWDAASDQSVLFGRTGEYLARTGAFAAARFVRVLGIKPTGQEDTTRVTTTQSDPVFVLDAGKTYDLELFHAQPRAPSAPEPFMVGVDGTTVKTIGHSGFDVSSRYDRVTVRLVATQAAALEDRATVVVIEPGAGVQGPRAVMEMRVRAGRGRAIGVATGQALALIAVALAGTLTGLSLGLRVALAVVGALAAVGLGLVGASVLKTPTMPSPAKSN